MELRKERIAHPLKNSCSSMGITIVETGWGFRDKRSAINKERWNRKQNIMVFFLRGKGKLESASTGLVELSPGDLFFIPKGIWHRYGPEPGEEWYEFWIVFEGLMAENLVMHAMGGCYDRQKCTLINIGINQELFELFELLFQASGNNNHKKCVTLFFEILQVIENCCNSKKNITENFRIQRLIQRINENPDHAFDFKQEAKMLKISYPCLRKEFVRITGEPPYKYLLNQRMQYACHLLANGRSVKETCYEINMKDPAHFSKLFKKKIGMSPKSFVELINL